MLEKAKKLLKSIYGYDNFREGQAHIINSVLVKNDTLGIIATGGGKSICYQIPALLFNGVTLVISPLISLMKDQVDSLKIVGINSAFLNSSLTKEEFSSIYRELKKGSIKILYVSPERLISKSFIELMKNINLSLLAVDEAHCISQWGHDFRKTYLDIPKFLELLGKRLPILALTASATPQVKEDIINKLHLKNPDIHTESFDRNNIFLKVEKGKDPEQYIVKYLLQNKEKSGIIYASTRKEVDNLYSYLKDIKNFEILRYHAGLDSETRKEAQEKFVKDEIKIIVATNAFGMGIDKSNVRFVIHRNIPKDIESYYQEIGRIGRDGAPGEAILLYYEEDESIHKYFIDNNLELSQELKELKLKKLDDMVEYAYLESCYREHILKYFGEKRIKNYCSNCHNCSSIKDVENLTEEAQMIFSCIGRARETIGISTLVNILLGKIDTKVEKKGYQSLSTFGIMKDKNREWLEEFINFLISEKYLYQSAGSFPVLLLTEKAFSIIRNLKTLKRKKDEQISFDYYSDPLFKMLLNLRKEIADDENVAPYIIFSDYTLMEIASNKPTNRWDMLKIRGIGNQKFKNYGIKFLNLINEYIGDSSLSLQNTLFFDKNKLEFLKQELDIKNSIYDIDRALKKIILD